MKEDKSTYKVLGIMSGTSMDGLDLAICTFNNNSGKWSYSIEASQTVIYPDDILQRLNDAFTSKASELAELDTLLGSFIGITARQFIDKHGNVDLVASHGHTIFHEPDKGYTYQIGNGAVIAAKTGVLTVCDFRSGDVAKGGQGAPLVPIGDELLFSEYDACVNLGGFANISYQNGDRRIAYDICPTNFVLNRLAKMLEQSFDEDGKLSEEGVVMLDLYVTLNSNEYYLKNPPKTLGQEWVEDNLFSRLTSDIDIKNVLRTYCEHISHQIGKALEKVEGKDILFTGGGVYNKFLMKLIQGKTKKNIIIPDTVIVDMKEAMIFAFLGILRTRNEANSLASVTGASQDVVNGAVYLP